MSSLRILSTPYILSTFHFLIKILIISRKTQHDQAAMPPPHLHRPPAARLLEHVMRYILFLKKKTNYLVHTKIGFKKNNLNTEVTLYVCGFFMFRISHIDSLGFMCSFYISFCDSFPPLFCKGFIYITMAWFFQSLFFFSFSKFATSVWMLMTKFLRSYVIISRDTPNSLNFDVISLCYCNWAYD